MARTDSAAVEELLGDDFGVREDGSTPDTDQFIAAANMLVTRMVTCASKRGVTFNSTELELIERWLSAHMYVMSDQNYSSRSNMGRSGSFQGQTAMNLDASKYGQTAQVLDVSGCLSAMSKRVFVQAGWLGTLPEDQDASS